ncbi:NAD-dependent epimerase/dehydratase family protein [Skermanella pratensis]|uniref:NAD-dependent epimerase/dehydratase family protein n=1 Tax=Skermanella pratensis TaxID=2233999 RepID=UPI0013019977|nr:NAD-dependent epimerase/dehydratase family protein [Skermanella pratensis]
MKTVVISGAAGLIGSEAARYFDSMGFRVIGIDNDMRQEFFGPEASTTWNQKRLISELKAYIHLNVDIRDDAAVEKIFCTYNSEISLIVHTAAQPSHDWAARAPKVDFTVNANGTLNLLEATRKHCPEAVFIFTSTNKVYGDTPNRLPLVELNDRWEVDESHPYHAYGIDEGMSIDQSKHSLFGVSKVAADVMVQEYGRYFGLKTGCFRGGCLTGPAHSGAQLHGFLAYLMRCAIRKKPYSIFGYKGKQVRDNIHAHDLVSAFAHFYANPRPGEVYNIGGSRHSYCSMLMAIRIAEELSGNEMQTSYVPENRAGDHIWWISDVRKFQSHYPDWRYAYDLKRLMAEIYEALADQRRLESADAD